MLIYLSDLQFVDGTAGKHNVPSEASRIFLDGAGRAVKMFRSGKLPIRQMRLVSLGDIFNLLGGRLQGLLKLRAEPERIYVSGNHHRLCNRFTSGTNTPYRIGSSVRHSRQGS